MRLLDAVVRVVMEIEGEKLSQGLVKGWTSQKGMRTLIKRGKNCVGLNGVAVPLGDPTLGFGFSSRFG